MRPPISHDGSDQFTRKGTWTPEEDDLLVAYIRRYGIWNWTEMPKAAGLMRSGKSCRLRWMNYLRPDIRRGNFRKEEEELILRLHEMMGNKWSAIAARLPGRTDNDIKNYWHTHLKKRIKKHKEMQSTGLMQGMETITPEPGTKHDINSPQKEQVPLLSNSIPMASNPECSSATDGSTGSSSASSVQEPSRGLWDDQFKSFSMEGLFWMEDNSWPSYTDYLWLQESAYSITSYDEVASDFWDDLFMH